MIRLTWNDTNRVDFDLARPHSLDIVGVVSKKSSCKETVLVSDLRGVSCLFACLFDGNGRDSKDDAFVWASHCVECLVVPCIVFWQRY